jgi:eukaryotic-like serine/threonine-protein kinase
MSETKTTPVLSVEAKGHKKRIQFKMGDLISDCFEIRKMLGEGGMGQVFEALDRSLNRRVALKVGLHKSFNAALRKEAQALAALRHSSLATVYAYRVEPEFEYIVMERILGVSLEAALDRCALDGQKFSVLEALQILNAVVEALTVVHSAAIVHRDIKPSNIMLAPGNRIVLMDFGLFLPEFDLERQEVVAGSPQYMAPESIMNEIEIGQGHLVDLYALGVVAYEMLTGDVPFAGSSVEEVWDKHMSAAIPDVCVYREDVPARFSTLVQQLLAKDPRNRPQSSEAVMWEIRSILASMQNREAVEPFSILIVDDDQQIAKMLSMYLKKQIPGVDIEVAADGESALMAIRKRMPHLLFLDLHMPRMNGIELCMYLRGSPQADVCTIVPLSAAASEDDVNLLKQLRIHEFVPKGANMLKSVARIATSIYQKVNNSTLLLKSKHDRMDPCSCHAAKVSARRLGSSR